MQRKRWKETGVTPGKPGSFTANILVKVVPVYGELKTFETCVLLKTHTGVLGTWV